MNDISWEIKKAVQFVFGVRTFFITRYNSNTDVHKCRHLDNMSSFSVAIQNESHRRIKEKIDL